MFFILLFIIVLVWILHICGDAVPSAAFANGHICCWCWSTSGSSTSCVSWVSIHCVPNNGLLSYQNEQHAACFQGSQCLNSGWNWSLSCHGWWWSFSLNPKTNHSVVCCQGLQSLGMQSLRWIRGPLTHLGPETEGLGIQISDVFHFFSEVLAYRCWLPQNTHEPAHSRGSSFCFERSPTFFRSNDEFVHIYTYIHVVIDIYIYSFCIHIYIDIEIYIFTYTYSYKQTYTYAHIYMCIKIYIYTNISKIHTKYTYLYTYIHTLIRCIH